jgi:pimeloyl-ACP methyl ester carboxylesterase
VRAGKNRPQLPRPERSVEPLNDSSLAPAVRGFLHRPENPNGDGLVLTHGAGSNCNSPLLIAVAEQFAEAGLTVLRCDLPFRQVRSYGPPRPGDAEHDREGLKNAVGEMKKLVSGRTFLGGHSYGGRQATMLCVDQPGLVGVCFCFPILFIRRASQLSCALNISLNCKRRPCSSMGRVIHSDRSWRWKRRSS